MNLWEVRGTIKLIKIIKFSFISLLASKQMKQMLLSSLLPRKKKTNSITNLAQSSYRSITISSADPEHGAIQCVSHSLHAATKHIKRTNKRI